MNVIESIRHGIHPLIWTMLGADERQRVANRCVLRFAFCVLRSAFLVAVGQGKDGMLMLDCERRSIKRPSCLILTDTSSYVLCLMLRGRAATHAHARARVHALTNRMKKNSEM